MPFKERELLSGHKVNIAYTEDLQPTAHGPEYEKRWNPDSKRETLSFYASTAEYMRNEWTEENARSHEVELDGKKLLLFFDERTRTWNSPEALDVDHVTPWREHLAEKEVWSREDAMLAYNDTDNLRTVPATYNRARNAADAILDTKGADSKEWRDWLDKKERFDASKDYPAYDPDADGVNRNAKTVDAEWAPGTTRKALGFDDPIKTIWLDHALKDAYAGQVKVPDPDHPDDRSRDHDVQLFRCSATNQLVTRGGLDIDHEIPFAVALQKMLDMNREAREQAQVNGDEPPPALSKADVLDLYNNPENLRLVSRSANSAHEWELGLDGQLYDPKLVDAEYATPEPKAIVVEDHEPVVYEDGIVMGEDAATVLQKRDRDHADTPNFALDEDDDNSQSPNKRTKETVTPREAALRDLHSGDAELFAKVKAGVEKLDPVTTGPLAPTQQENLAMVAVLYAREKGIGIDHVVPSVDGRTLFGVQGPLDADTGKIAMPIQTFKDQPLEVTAEFLGRQRQEAARQAQVQAPVVPQNTPLQIV
jgi:hypothetical protein